MAVLDSFIKGYQDSQSRSDTLKDRALQLKQLQEERARQAQQDAQRLASQALPIELDEANQVDWWNKTDANPSVRGAKQESINAKRRILGLGDMSLVDVRPNEFAKDMLEAQKMVRSGIHPNMVIKQLATKYGDWLNTQSVNLENSVRLQSKDEMISLANPFTKPKEVAVTSPTFKASSDIHKSMFEAYNTGGMDAVNALATKYKSAPSTEGIAGMRADNPQQELNIGNIPNPNPMSIATHEATKDTSAPVTFSQQEIDLALSDIKRYDLETQIANQEKKKYTDELAKYNQNMTALNNGSFQFTGEKMLHAMLSPEWDNSQHEKKVEELRKWVSDNGLYADRVTKTMQLQEMIKLGMVPEDTKIEDMEKSIAVDKLAQAQNTASGRALLTLIKETKEQVKSIYEGQPDEASALSASEGLMRKINEYENIIRADAKLPPIPFDAKQIAFDAGLNVRQKATLDNAVAKITNDVEYKKALLELNYAKLASQERRDAIRAQISMYRASKSGSGGGGGTGKYTIPKVVAPLANWVDTASLDDGTVINSDWRNAFAVDSTGKSINPKGRAAIINLHAFGKTHGLFSKDAIGNDVFNPSFKTDMKLLATFKQKFREANAALSGQPIVPEEPKLFGIPINKLPASTAPAKNTGGKTNKPAPKPKASSGKPTYKGSVMSKGKRTETIIERL